MGHSRGGHIGFRVAEQRPDLLRKLVLAEPGGDLDASLDPAGAAAGSLADCRTDRGGGGEGQGWRYRRRAELFVDMIDGDGAWKRLPAAPRQQLRDNVFTLIGQVGENRKPFTKARRSRSGRRRCSSAAATPWGSLATMWRVLAQHVPGARTVMIAGASHWMFDQAPQEYCDAVMEFLAA